jgi:hypothetical protein
VKLPATWTGPSDHLMHEPWIPPFFRDGLAALLTELEAAGPAGLADRRTAFRQQGQVAATKNLSSLERQEIGMEQLLDLRAELLVGVTLLRARVLERISQGTPDFECRWQHTRVRRGGDYTCTARGRLGYA